MKKETKIVCPTCGTEFAIPEHETVGFGTIIGRDSNLGTIHPIVVGQTTTTTHTNTSSNNQTSKQMKAIEKLEALRAAGVNVDNLFSMAGISGQETIARLQDGQLTIVPEDDPIFAAIINGGTVPNRRLFRRWVMSQVFHMMNHKGLNGDGFVAALNAKGFQYQWKMMLEEFRVQSVLAVSDPENFKERNRWFNSQRFIECAEDYIEQVRAFVKSLRIKHCKHMEYVRIRRRNVFVADLEAKVYRPLYDLIEEARYTDNPKKLYNIVSRFVKQMKMTHYEYGITMSASFKDAYKGAGAYFTMKNLILFHGATFKVGCVKTNQERSLVILEAKAKEYQYEGWRLFGVMKKLIADNNIDIVKKMNEWKKK